MWAKRCRLEGECEISIYSGKEPVVETAIIGQGEVVIQYIDSNSETLLQEKLGLSGSPTVKARGAIDLSVETTSGRRALAALLVRLSNPKPRVTFDGELPLASHGSDIKKSAARPSNKGKGRSKKRSTPCVVTRCPCRGKHDSGLMPPPIA